MTASIGIQFYSLRVEPRAKPPYKREDGCKKARIDLKSLIQRFIRENSAPNILKDGNHSLSFQPHSHNGEDMLGITLYGTSGHSSDLIGPDNELAFERKPEHLETIPLFYAFIFKNNYDYPLLALQNFSVSACKTLLQQKIIEEFSKDFPDFRLVFKKVALNDECGSFFSKEVKEFELIRWVDAKDPFEAYKDGKKVEQIREKLSLSNPRMSLGLLGGLVKNFKKSGSGLVIYDDEEYDEVYAKVKFGKKIRKVNVIGSDTSSGRIDLTDNVKLKDDGHPDFESIKEQTYNIADDIFAMFIA